MKTDRKSFENFVVLLVMIAEVQRFTFNSENQTTRYKKKVCYKVAQNVYIYRRNQTIFLIN